MCTHAETDSLIPSLSCGEERLGTRLSLSTRESGFEATKTENSRHGTARYRVVISLPSRMCNMSVFARAPRRVHPASRAGYLLLSWLQNYGRRIHLAVHVLSQLVHSTIKVWN